MNRFLVTITPPTPNGDLHIGHIAGPFLGADCYQRCKTDPPQRLKIDPGVNLLL